MARPPATFTESVTANCRPQPAIPALLVLVFTLMFAVSKAAPPGGMVGPTWATWLVATGVVASCGLAIAAGFCSFFPPAAWMVLAYVGLGVVGRMPGALVGRAAVFTGMAAAAAMIAIQFWRVRTGRFVPTIDEEASAG